MRWPWSKPEEFLVEEEPAAEEPADSTDALRRAREALREADAKSDAMHQVARRIRGERQADHFSDAMYRAMRKRET